MKTRSTLAMAAAAALLSGITAVSVAQAAQMHGSMMTPSDSLNLSATQQKTAWNDLKQTSDQTAPSDFAAATGSKVPSAVTIKPVPTRTARDVSSLRPYDFAMVSGKILIVNPKDRTVAEVLSG
jgi:hypothetical protein